MLGSMVIYQGATRGWREILMKRALLIKDPLPDRHVSARNMIKLGKLLHASASITPRTA